MSTATTLAALQNVLVPALNPLGCSVRLDPGTIPVTVGLPMVVLTELEDHQWRMTNAEKGNPDDRPNLYNITVLVEQFRGDGMQLTAAFATNRAIVAAIKACFLLKATYTLPDAAGDGQVLGAGDMIDFVYDKAGPMLTYFGTPYVGVAGTISVEELYELMT